MPGATRKPRPRPGILLAAGAAASVALTAAVWMAGFGGDRRPSPAEPASVTISLPSPEATAGVEQPASEQDLVWLKVSVDEPAAPSVGQASGDVRSGSDAPPVEEPAAPAGPLPAERGRRYVVYAAAFRTPAAAQRACDQLTAEGLQLSVTPASDPSGRIWSVCRSRFIGLDEARTLARRITGIQPNRPVMVAAEMRSGD